MRQINAKIDKFEMTFEHGNYKHPELVYITVPDEMDEKVSKFFRKIKLPFEELFSQDALKDENIISRMCLSDDDEMAGRVLQSINVKKLDTELQKDKELYIGYKGRNGSYLRYERFKKYLMTNQEINAPGVYFKKKKDGSVQTLLHDGRHRFAVLRDMGLKNIPVAMSKEDIETAKELGLI